jgi:hypothetical protein
MATGARRSRAGPGFSLASTVPVTVRPVATPSPTYVEAVEVFATGYAEAASALRGAVTGDWSVAAGTLDWSCWRTVDHVTDCIFSYTLQLAGEVRDGWLHLEELHAKPDATPEQLLDALGTVARLFEVVLGSTPPDSVASDGLSDLDGADWAARALNELLLHTYDVASGLGSAFEPSAAVCAFVLASPKLWMYDGVDRADTHDPWRTMLVSSGRAVAAADP